MDKKFEHTNDVDNTIEVIDENSFFAVVMSGTHYASMTIKKEYMKKLHQWLGERLK